MVDDLKIDYRKIDIIVIFFIFIIGFLMWRLSKDCPYSFWHAYFLSAPDIYRLQSTITVFLYDNYSINFFILNSLIFIFSICVVFFIERPKKSIDLLLFIIIICGFIVRPNYYNSIMYPLLILLISTKNKWFLIPLVMVKEFVFFLGVCYIFLYQCIDINGKKIDGKELLKLILIALIGGIIYIGIRYFLIGDVPYMPGVSMFMLPLTGQRILNLIEAGHFGFIFEIGFIIVCVGFLLKINTKKEFMLLIFNVIPITIFAIFYELQLWIPLMFIILYHRINNQKVISLKTHLTNLKEYIRNFIKTNIQT